MSQQPIPERKANRLIHETSPYLLQHAHNPVDWYPWGAEALARARELHRPIFLSIGYSSCHWCHVMERESFENDDIARVLNEKFVPIKVDREERPDLDEVYMKAVQLLTGSGGWPMSVWLTPSLKPFFGGTYFPPDDRWGRPGFRSLLLALAKYWDENAERIESQADSVVAQVRAVAAPDVVPGAPSSTAIDAAVRAFTGLFDAERGGFGGAPKFPHPMDLAFLLRQWRRRSRGDATDRGVAADVLRMVTVTLAAMARGGIYDQLGGGFHRYSTDDEWRVPHFEKMLYDNALLAPVYADASLAVDGDEKRLFERVARETCEWALREMTDRAGGFWSAQDADSEGVEGKFFAWTRDEIEAVIGKDDAERFCAAFGVTPDGNFEDGKTVLMQKCDEAERASLGPAIAKLFAARESRVKPFLDDKVLTEWNGLMISALARVGARLAEPRYVRAAERAATFLLDVMCKDGRVLRTFRAGTARIDGFLPDWVDTIAALLDVAAVSANPRFLDAALALDRTTRSRFAAVGGGFATTAEDHETLIARARDPFDNAVPSGNSVAAMNLVRIGEITGDSECDALARATLGAFAPMMEEAPAGFGQMMQALDLVRNPPTVVVLVGAPDSAELAALARVVHGSFRAGVFAIVTNGSRADDESAPAILRGKIPRDGRATAYACSAGTCQAPVTDPRALAQSLDAVA